MTPDAMVICLVVNKSLGRLGPSETFLHAHIDGLDGHVLPLIGNPLRRRLGSGSPRFLLPQGLPSRAMRFVLRASGIRSAHEQDTRALVRYFHDQRVDVVLAEYGPTAVSVRDACERAGIPLITHFHGWDAYSLPRQPDVARAYQDVFRYSSAIVGVSTHMVDALVELGAPRAKTNYNPCGATVRGAPASPASAPPRFVAVGRMTPKKAPQVTLRAFSALLRGVPDARLDMIGDGPLLAECRQLVDALDIGRSVTLHGATPHDAVFDLLRQGRCFVQHSVIASDGDSEGTPVSLLEAMAIGLPVVATRHGGIRDVVEDGVTGLLVDEQDENGMTEAMARLATDPALAGRLGHAGAQAVASRWSMEHSLARLSAIIQDVYNQERRST